MWHLRVEERATGTSVYGIVHMTNEYVFDASVQKFLKKVGITASITRAGIW